MTALSAPLRRHADEHWAAVHVSAPPDLLRCLGPDDRDALADPSSWGRLLPGDWIVLGPSRHAYLGQHPGGDNDPRVRRVGDRGELDELRAGVTEAEWSEANFTADGEWFAVAEDDRLVAAANVTTYGNRGADIGVLTHLARRGQGHGRAVARRATSYAVTHHEAARWRALETNRASRAVARALGFVDYGSNCAARPPRSA